MCLMIFITELLLDERTTCIIKMFLFFVCFIVNLVFKTITQNEASVPRGKCVCYLEKCRVDLIEH